MTLIRNVEILQTRLKRLLVYDRRDMYSSKTKKKLCNTLLLSNLSFAYAAQHSLVSAAQVNSRYSALLALLSSANSTQQFATMLSNATVILNY